VGVYPSVEANQGHVAKAGYWLAQPYWGRGIATEALSMMLEMSQTAEWANICNSGNPIVRYEAEIFEWNAASARVLEKNGFSLEARLTKSYFKDGKFVDGLLYAKVL
jgi:RimJ/RimL family protein N-acetyltransferase